MELLESSLGNPRAPVGAAQQHEGRLACFPLASSTLSMFHIVLFVSFLSISASCAEGSPHSWKSKVLSFFSSKYIERIEDTTVYYPSPRCAVTCRGLFSENSTFECTSKGLKVPCNKSVCPGTVASVRCKSEHKLPANRRTTSVCLKDGTWSNELPQCKIEVTDWWWNPSTTDKTDRRFFLIFDKDYSVSNKTTERPVVTSVVTSTSSVTKPQPTLPVKAIPAKKTICKEGCSGLFSSTTLYECVLRGALVPCNITVCPDTVVTAKCKPAFRIPKGNTEKTSAVCLSTNKWSNSLPACVQDCGKYNPRVEQALVAFGMESKAGEFPWHVGIYYFRETDNSWQQICGGSIVTPTIILTAAHCVVETSSNVVVGPTTLKIAAGKFFRDWDAEELYVQKSNVTEIIMPDRYGGKINSYEQDIAMLEISPPLNFSAVVMPCCIDWKLEYTVEPNQLSVVVGWGKTESLLSGPTLRYARLPYLDYNMCVKTVPHMSYLPLLTEDKFCAGYTNGTGAGEGDSGGGLTFQMDDRYYVYGVVSVKPNTDNTIAIFTNVTHPHHLLWFHKYLLWSERRRQFPELIAKEGDCLLPAALNEATFTVSGCLHNDTSNKCRGLEGIPVDNSTYLEYSCKEGYYLPEGRRNTSHCVNEFWTAPPVCEPLCPPLKSEVSIYFCYYESVRIPCSQYLYPGTTVIFNCALTTALIEAECLPNGRWSRIFQTCLQTCGKTGLTPKTKPTHAEAVKTKFSEFPWFMGIYRKSVNGTFAFLCPATYTSFFSLFTSAACLYDAETNEVINPKELRIAGGKEFMDWDILNDELEVHGVSEIFMFNEEYNRESYDSFTNDIAVLSLDGTFVPKSTYHYQSCLNVNIRVLTLSAEDVGTIPGWGISSESPEEKDFEKISLPHIAMDECRTRFGTPELLPFMTDDKFCVLHDKGIGIKKYVSGSGYFYSKDGHFAAGGVGSFTPPGQDNFTLFSNVTHYGIWISRKLSSEGYQYMLDNGL